MVILYVSDLKTQEVEHEETIEKLRTEYDTQIEDMSTDHNSRIKQLVKEFNLKVAEKDRDFQKTFSDAVGENINFSFSVHFCWFF